MVIGTPNSGSRGVPDASEPDVEDEHEFASEPDVEPRPMSPDQLARKEARRSRGDGEA
jgi:hypothetical protein